MLVAETRRVVNPYLVICDFLLMLVHVWLSVVPPQVVELANKLTVFAHGTA